jgi:hypothetical protein
MFLLRRDGSRYHQLPILLRALAGAVRRMPRIPTGPDAPQPGHLRSSRIALAAIPLSRVQEGLDADVTILLR